MQHPEAHKQDWKYHLWRSTWLSAAWNWFMMFAAAACEAILTVSVIYSCARLLPTLQTPIWLDNTVFIWQMVALDVGGLSLRKMANQARKDGNKAGATFASRVSNALITIMVLNVVLSILQGVAHLDAHLVAVVEGGLLVARAVMAVLYAAVIHSLREDEQSEPATPALDVQQQIALAVANLQTHVEQRLMDLSAEQSQMQASLQQIQNSMPAIDETALTEAVTRNLEARFEAAMRQKRVVSEAKPEARQLEAPKARREAKPEARKPPHEAAPHIVPLRQPGAVLTEKRAAVYRLMQQDGRLSSYAIAEQTGIPVSTVQRYMKDWREHQREAEHEANGTEE
jgi:predicted HTH transcriptional regulator